MATKEQGVDVKVPDGYKLKTKGAVKLSDLILKDKKWITCSELSLQTRFAFVGRYVEEFKVPVAEEI